MTKHKQARIEVQEYSFIEAIKSVQRHTQDGYVLDDLSNAGYPQQYGTVFALNFVTPEEYEKMLPVEVPAIVLPKEAVKESEVDPDALVAEVSQMTDAEALTALTVGDYVSAKPEVEPAPRKEIKTHKGHAHKSMKVGQ